MERNEEKIDKRGGGNEIGEREEEVNLKEEKRGREKNHNDGGKNVWTCPCRE